MVVETDAGEWCEVAGAFTELLLSCVEGLCRPSFLGRYRPGPAVRYDPDSWGGPDLPW